MSTAINPNDFVILGQSLSIVLNPERWDVSAIAQELRKFLDRLESCGLSSTRRAAIPLERIQLRYSLQTRTLEAGSVRELNAYMQPVVEVLNEELCLKRVVKSDVSAVPDSLRNLPSTLCLTETQSRLHEETVRCLELHAFRASTVMAWCLAYDLVRHWVFKDSVRLQVFNSTLATYMRNKSKRLYEDISDYEDFISSKAPAEGKVIEICENAGFIGGKVSRKLRHYLDPRNDYAHATSLHPTENQAKSYVDNVLDIVTSPPF